VVRKRCRGKGRCSTCFGWAWCRKRVGLLGAWPIRWSRNYDNDWVRIERYPSRAQLALERFPMSTNLKMKEAFQVTMMITVAVHKEQTERSKLLLRTISGQSTPFVENWTRTGLLEFQRREDLPRGSGHACGSLGQSRLPTPTLM
jgi:hypothetical protein